MASHFNSNDISSAILRYHIDLVTEELIEEYPDELALVRGFCEILDCLWTIIAGDPSVLHDETKSGCICIEFISHHFPQVLMLDAGISTHIRRDVITEENICGLSKMTNKYQGMLQILLRQEQDYIEFVEEMEKQTNHFASA